MIKKLLPGRLQFVFHVINAVEIERQLPKFKSMQQEEKQKKATEIVHNHVGFAMGAALVPFPGADLLAVSAVQLNMLRQLAKLYNVGFIDSLGKNVISAIVGSSAARLGASLVKAIPGVGTIIGELSMPVLSGASTYALGRVIAWHFHKGGTLEDLDLRRAKKEYASEMENGQQVATEISQKGAKSASPADEAMEKIRKLSEMKNEGIISEEEFQQLKTRLLESVK